MDVALSTPTVTGLRKISANPTTGAFQVHFSLSKVASVTLEVTDIAGRTVSMLPVRQWEAGEWSTSWNPNRSEPKLPAGVYWLRMSAGGEAVGLKKFIMIN